MVRDKGTEIRYFLFSFTDLFGVMRSKLVPAHAASRTCRKRGRWIRRIRRPIST